MHAAVALCGAGLAALMLGAGAAAAQPAPAGPVSARFSAPTGCHDYDLLDAGTGLSPRALPITRLCPFEPRTDCRGEMLGGRSKVALKNHASRARKDTVKWSFKKGEETRPADLGDPTVDTDYELCVYLAFEGVCWLILHPDALAGPGWTAKRNGFKFKMRRDEHAEGLRKLRLRWGEDRKTRLKLKGKGELLGLELPPFPEQSEVLVQLYNSVGECWSTEFGDDARANSRKFRDRSDD